MDTRSLEQVREFSEEISRWLLAQGVSLVVVACNTASAAALSHLRQFFPHTPFVGMEPAVKPAAILTHSGVVGVLATPATFQGALYASLVERFANGVQLLPHTCPGLVQQIEKGRLNTRKTRAILQEALQPMLAHGIDTVVLGCTHYPFVIPLIQKIAGAQVQVIDPAPAVARQARRLLGLEQISVANPSIAGFSRKSRSPDGFLYDRQPGSVRPPAAGFVGCTGASQQTRMEQWESWLLPG